MPPDLSTFKTDLTSALDRFDKEAATGYCDQLIEALYDPDTRVPLQTLEYALQALRNKRLYPLMQKLGDCFIQLGLQTYKIRRQYAQALIDQGIYAAALAILRQLATEAGGLPTGSPRRRMPPAVGGLIGRIYKQQYVNANRPADARIAELMKQAIDHYRQAYVRGPAGRLWHGINLVALIARAKKDQLDLGELPDQISIANQILDRIRDLDSAHTTAAWEFATAIEASIALNDPKEALALDRPVYQQHRRRLRDSQHPPAVPRGVETGHE